MRRFLIPLVCLFGFAHAQPLRLALDWVPNTNHTGIFVALANGWYEEEGIELRILPFGNVAPNVLVATGRADVGVSGTESVLSAAAIGEPVVSIAAIMSTNTAALAVRADSGIERPRELDGKLYASIGVPYEHPVIATVIRSDGGEGSFRDAQLTVAGFDAVLAGRVDFAWVFEGWQGVQAKRAGVELNLFNFKDYGVPDYYTPVLTASPGEVEKNADALQAFLRATRRGYEFAAENPEEAAELLIATAPAGSFPDPGLVRDSQRFVSRHYVEAGRPWGVQRPEYWEGGYPRFLLDAEVFTDVDGNVVQELELASLYTNMLLPKK
jgi:ABC-type nitrate/sulfonate/bicarbonate transport system substrate-binding protein